MSPTFPSDPAQAGFFCLRGCGQNKSTRYSGNRISRGGIVLGRKPKLQETDVEQLRALVAQRPTASLDELTNAFVLATGVTVCAATIRRALRSAGIVRVVAKKSEGASSSTTPAPRRYGYREAHRDQGSAERYASCLTDAEWALAQDLFEPPAGGRGKPALYPRRRMVDACCYVLRTGCAWRLLPKSFPPWDAVYKAFRRWAAQDKFEIFHDRLRAQWRERVARSAAPSAAVLDAQSTRTSPQGGDKGFDAGKKVKGRKRNLVVDTLGLLLAVLITPASVQDRDAAAPVVAQACAKHPSLKTLFVDGAYSGGCAERLREAHQIDVQVVRHPANRTVGYRQAEQLPLFEAATVRAFVPLPKRWIVERTHAWNERARRLIMHHDRSMAVSTAWVWLAESRMLVRRISTSS